jgi:ABC-type histidine transport system ATPase subunit
MGYLGDEILRQVNEQRRNEVKEANVVSSSPTEEEKHQLRKLLEKHLTLVFQQLNKWMNQDGLMLLICAMDEQQNEVVKYDGCPH